MLNIATIPCSVRQGSRLTDAQKTMLFAELDSLKIAPSTHPAILPFSASLFISTEMPLWLSQGMKFLQRAWGLIQRPAQDAEDEFCIKFALNLNGALAELGWGGWKLVALPSVLKMSVRPNVTDKHPTSLFAFLASLRHNKKISQGDTDLVWRTRIEQCALARLEVLKGQTGTEAAAEINDILVLSSFFSDSVTPVLIDSLDQNLQGDVPADSRASSSWMIAMSLEALSRRDKAEWSGKVDQRKWAKHALERWSWSAEVLEAIVSLSREA